MRAPPRPAPPGAAAIAMQERAPAGTRGGGGEPRLSPGKGAAPGPPPGETGAGSTLRAVFLISSRCVCSPACSSPAVPLLPAQVQFLSEPLSMGTSLPRAVSCARLWFRVFLPRGKLRAVPGREGRPRAGCPGFCPARCRGGARPGSALPRCPAASAAAPSIAGIKNCGGGCSRRLAEAQANPFIRGGAEARKTFRVRSGGSSLEASGHGRAPSCRVSRGGGGWMCPRWNPRPAPAPPAAAPPPRPNPPSPLPSEPPRPLRWQRDKERSGAAAFPKAQLYPFSPCFGARGKSPITPPTVASFRRSHCPLLEDSCLELCF